MLTNISSPKVKARIFAFYLPQFHPIPENDEWWGKGFTEWTNVGKAKKLFPGHYQPHIPADLGYYDLRVPETREQQAQMAKEHGVEGFIYWHYWFGNGKRLLERPFNEVLSSGRPNYPFALAWANESWKGFAHGLTNRNVLIEQNYPGEQDYICHFYEILPALKDKRYITIEGKPMFMIYKPYELPNATQFINLWQELSKQNGLKGIYFVAHRGKVSKEEEIYDVKNLLSMGFDSVNFVRLSNYSINNRINQLRNLIRKFIKFPIIHSYKNYVKNLTNENDRIIEVIPTIIPNWDHTPRSGKEGHVLHNSQPQYFAQNIRNTLKNISNKPLENRIIFLKSWNEWAEGNYMEPDLKWGKEYLETLKREIID